MVGESEYEVVTPFRHGLVMRAAGERLSLTAVQAEFLLHGELIKAVAAPAPERKRAAKAAAKEVAA